MIDKAKIRKAHKVYTNVDGVQMCEMQFSKYLVMEQALAEFEELKRDVKRYFEIKNTIDKYERLNKKNEIPNELWVKFRYIKKDIIKLLKVGNEE